MSFNRQYWRIVLPLWAVAVVAFAGVAALASPTWGDVVAFAAGWGIFAVTLWWTLDTVRTYRAGERAQSPEAILKDRLARGEISTDEYQRVRQTLGEQ